MLGHEPGEELRGPVARRKEDRGHDDVEDGVGVRDLARNVGRGARDEIGERSDERIEERDPNDLERRMRRRDATSLGVLPDRRDERGAGRADVRAEDDRDGSGERENAGRREREREADRGRARPHDAGERRGDEQEHERLVRERTQHVGEERALREGRGAICDELHAEEEEAKAEDRLAHVFRGAAAGDPQEPANEHDERR